MANTSIREFSRRERQIMDIIYRLGQASAAQVRRQLPDPPSYSSVRALLVILERKGHLKHATQGSRYVYSPAQSRHEIGRVALRRVVRTFFEGSMEKAVAAYLSAPDPKLPGRDRGRLTALIRKGKDKP